MGTSKGYVAPTGGSWTKLKRDVSRFARDVGAGPPPSAPPDRPNPRIGDLLAQLVAALGGASVVASAGRTAGSAAGGASLIGGGAARTGAEFGGFATAVAEAGLDEALRRFDLDGLDGRPADEVIDAIAERLSDVPSGLDEAAAREALIKVTDELRGDASSLPELEVAYRRAMEAYGVHGLMWRYFGYYLYVLFCERFAERLARDPDRTDSVSVSSQVREYILLAVESRAVGREVGGIDWSGPEGIAISEAILAETLHIFEAEE